MTTRITNIFKSQTWELDYTQPSRGGEKRLICSDSTAPLACFQWLVEHEQEPHCCLETCHFHVCLTSASEKQCGISLRGKKRNSNTHCEQTHKSVIKNKRYTEVEVISQEKKNANKLNRDCIYSKLFFQPVNPLFHNFP